MDISFHYFAVKTLALTAGFDDRESQIIAQYSQYIDDYNPTWPRRYSNVPDWLRNKKGSDIYISSRINPMNFSPVTTGFMIPADIGYMLTKTFQKNVISPFHFIPVKQGDFRTFPVQITDGGDGSVIACQLLQAKADLAAAGTAGGTESVRQRELALMHIGMLLHTFADTYAHQTFSGYNEKCNNMKIRSVRDNASGNDITASLNGYIDKILKIYEDAEGKYSDKMFEIGHMLAGHLPDWTHITFELAFYDDNGQMERTYERNNTDTFTDAALEILDFLYECRGIGKLTGTGRSSFADRLKEVFKAADISDVEGDNKKCMERLINVWGSAFPQFHYSYDRSGIFDGIVKAARTEMPPAEDGLFPEMSDAFYHFNSYAEDLLIALYGDNPRK